MASTVNTCYVSVGCNRTPHCADWGNNKLLCYGASSAVAICQTEDSEGGVCHVRELLTGHKDRVNCTRWIRDHHKGIEGLVSGSVDMNAIVWENKNKKFEISQVLTGHTGPVTAVDALYLSPNTKDSGNHGDTVSVRTLVVSASSDSSLKVWNRDSGKEFVNTQTLTYGTGFILDLTLAVLPQANTQILACGGDDHKIHIYIESTDTDEYKFVPVITLPGHEDWVRTVDFTIDDCGDVLLASAAQDYMIRIWRFAQRDTDTGRRIESIQDLPLDKDIQMRENTFTFSNAGQEYVYAVSLESVLSGHENWVYSVKWKPRGRSDTGPKQELCLLSASMDKTMILWRPDADTGVWLEQVRVGEVGGNTLGLYGGLFSPDGSSILAHGYQGAFHHWKLNKETSTWDSIVTVGGHFESVQDIDWDRGGGHFLLSASLDQTVRLHAPWVKDGRQMCWYEIARPQIHGYDIQCLCMVNRYQFVSGADEKVLRVFDATRNFIENFCAICKLDADKEFSEEKSSQRAEGASVPALGLSNKAVFGNEAQNLTDDLEIKPAANDQYSDVYFKALSLEEPPSEEHLLQNTLWPEVQKLYGHGYEIFAVASDPGGTIIASACKAAKAEFAYIILWDTSTWTSVCKLEGHSLTVTQLAFSHNGQFLLSVSRDRTWCLYRRRASQEPESDPLFSRVAFVDKRTAVHSRIIWSCAWSHDNKYFITASRDKKAILWPCPDYSSKAIGTNVKPVSVVDIDDSATAVDMAPVTLKDNSYLVSVGLENGCIVLYKCHCSEQTKWTQLHRLDNINAHHLTVKRLRFRPCLGLAGIHGVNRSEVKDRDSWLQFASCGADHCVRIYNICLLDL